ncbi:MAG: hypothetical protein FD169_1120 [Bacillota bacterium]|nr:MAG: hypothetical protein FD169_1120 [Bacillota bacterium]MBS3949496.1 YitT family protein [Peptococcaceae bacterium]
MKYLKGYLWPIIVTVIGTFLSAMSYNQMLIPNRMLSGGVAGISIIINNLTGWPTGLLVLVMNIPILILGYKHIGGKFIILTSLAVLGFSIFLDVIPVQAAVDDLLLAAVFGGALNGIGLGLVLRVGGSTGGTDIIGVIANRKFSLSIGEVLMGSNAIIVGISAVLFDLTSALYTLIAMFVSARVVDTMQTSRGKKNVLIVSAQPEAVATAINTKLERGVTFLHGEGAYEHSQRKIILCVLTRYELTQLKETVLGIDPNAFMTISDTNEVIGRFQARSPFRTSK